MSYADIAARLKNVRLQRDRRGYTLIELVMVLTVTSILILGMGILVLTTRENIHINHQIRNAHEWGHAYALVWSNTVRHADKVDIRRQAVPSILDTEYTDPEDVRRRLVKHSFQYSNRVKMPIHTVNGNIHTISTRRGRLEAAESDHPNIFVGDRRDSFWVDARTHAGFSIKYLTRNDAPEIMRDNVLQLDFILNYQRMPTWDRGRPFQKSIPFSSTAYAVNPNWPVEKNPFGPSDDDD